MEPPAAMEMGSECTTQTFPFAFIFKSFFFSPLAGRRLGTGRGHGLSSRGMKLMTDHATAETASWLFNILSLEAILKLPD